MINRIIEKAVYADKTVLAFVRVNSIIMEDFYTDEYLLSLQAIAVDSENRINIETEKIKINLQKFKKIFLPVPIEDYMSDYDWDRLIKNLEDDPDFKFKFRSIEDNWSLLKNLISPALLTGKQLEKERDRVLDLFNLNMISREEMEKRLKDLART